MSSNNPNLDPQRSTAEQRAAAAKSTGRFGERPPSTRFYEAAPCEGPGCKNIVPAGMYAAQRTRNFCCDTCRNRYEDKMYVVGICECGCGMEVLGRKQQVGKKKFYDDEHRRRYLYDRVLAPTGAFLPLVKEYMAGDAKNTYKASTLATVQSSVAKFFRFAVAKGIVDINEVRPATITEFIASEQARGAMYRNYVGHMSTFFNWLIDEERYTRPNPVIPRRHYQNFGEPSARPYSDAELALLWGMVEASGKYELMLAFAIGEECGLRIGEVANIRLSDVDLRTQKIFVRLPTKNNRTRFVPFHDKVKKYVSLWLERRSEHCPSDHLLHNKAHKPFNQNQLDAWFKKLLRTQGDLAASFNFHRLRHTWATRLMNNGMELAVLKELGGWAKWNSMQRYIKVLEGTVRSQYEAAYKKLEEKQEAIDDEPISMLEFAAIAATTPATSADSAA